MSKRAKKASTSLKKDKSSPKRQSKNKERLTLKGRFKKSLQKTGKTIAHPFILMYTRLRDNRRDAVHKTFVLTKRRDLPRTPFLNNSWLFTLDVFKTIWRYKWTFSLLIVLYLVLVVFLTGTIKGQNMALVEETIAIFNEEAGFNLDAITKGAVVVGSGLTGMLNGTLTEVEQLYMSILYIFTCLVVVWLLRHFLAGNTVRLRDGLYNAGAPIVPIICLLSLVVLQAFPAAIGIFVMNILSAGGVLQGGIETGLFWTAIGFLLVLTLYFASTTLFALIIVTVPGTYPWAAYKLAKQIILGQRRRLLFRLLWLIVLIVVLWFGVLVPLVLLVNSLTLQNTIVIPVLVHLMTGASLVVASTYVYLLYRRMIDDPTQ